MKFQFCGGVPCPEWFLAESSILTKITAIKLKLITSNLILFLLQNSNITPKILKLLEGSAFTETEINALVSTLEFIIRNAICFDVSDLVLNKELVDLGLPKENVESIVKTYKSNIDKLKEKLVGEYGRVGSQVEITGSVSQLVGVGAGTAAGDGDQDAKGVHTFADMTLKYKNEQGKKVTENFIVTAGVLEEMIYSLEKARKVIKQIETNASG